MRGKSSPHHLTLSWGHKMYLNYKDCPCSGVFEYGQSWYFLFYNHPEIMAINRNYTEGAEGRERQEWGDKEAWTLVFAVLRVLLPLNEVIFQTYGLGYL